MLVMFNAAVPVLLSVTAFAPLVLPTCWLPKSRLVGERLTTGAPPLPVRFTVWGLLGALSVMVMAPVRVPVTVGVNVTLIVQLVPAASAVPQLLVWA